MPTVEDLLPHLRSELVSANSGATAAQLSTLMLVNRISRVPIIDGDGRKCRGIVRMRALFDRPAGVPASLSAILEEAPPEIRVDEPLFRAVERLRGKPEVLVRAKEGKLVRLLTPRALADWWYQYANPFLVVEDLETALRDLLRPLEGERLKAAVNVATVDDMTAGQYKDAWDRLGKELPALGDLDAKTVGEILASFSKRRNQLMHFRLDDRAPLEPDLRRFAELQRRIRAVIPARQVPG